MPKSRKRRRNDVPGDESCAECPFSVRLVCQEDATDRVRDEPFPFAPAGKFMTSETLKVHYSVHPMEWGNMTAYKNFCRK
jgi:hypothetical protein